MAKTDTRQVGATVAEIERLSALGCDLVRLAVPDEDAARAVALIKKDAPIPVVADIHFNHRLALMCIDSGVDKLRLNPGNIGSPERVREVARAARDRGVPIRVGANAGSITAEARHRARGDLATALVESALEQANILEEAGHRDLVVSVKAYDLDVVVRAYREIATRTDYPLHLGVTEAGSGLAGTVRSAIGIGALLLEGIGDTIRVSLTGPADEEVQVGREILLATGLREGLLVVSCPTCGRSTVDLVPIVKEVREALKDVTSPLRVAVMGCEVNGPGEARDADIGVAVAGGSAVLFVGGRAVRRVRRQEIADALLKEAGRLAGGSAGRGPTGEDGRGPGAASRLGRRETD